MTKLGTAVEARVTLVQKIKPCPLPPAKGRGGRKRRREQERQQAGPALPWMPALFTCVEKRLNVETWESDDSVKWKYITGTYDTYLVEIRGQAPAYGSLGQSYTTTDGHFTLTGMKIFYRKCDW